MQKPCQPDYWCKEWYYSMKQKGYTDQEIADQLYIHINTLYRWKRWLDIPKFAYCFSNAKGRN
jgi:hypothetical protein